MYKNMTDNPSEPDVSFRILLLFFIQLSLRFSSTIGDVMVTVLVSIAKNHEFDPGQVKAKPI